jgi:hypothetical protein
LLKENVNPEPLFMENQKYYLETEPRAWNGVRQMHAETCKYLAEESAQVVFIGSFNRPHEAMAATRKKHRRASACPFCCKGRAIAAA